ncbi:AraC family transcriptional regulator [Paenibacillus antri]|uniref:AraC family transcriptional regulator n=1 Tax=Paenibacillus antri TaxID=2582848 RepID=A0A5R9GB65_9BACL|nr:helix-turn-helix domain-containing protein [Paenibacillus antri]TLS51556.1 AraC family transcriptional regulator [Paenibacillus antri]
MRIHQYVSRPVFPGYLLYPESYGWYREEPEHREHRPPGQLPYYNLHFVFGGRGELVWKNRRYELAAGQGFLYAPDQEQRYGAVPDEPWDVRWVHFFGEGAAALLGDKGIGEPWVFALGDVSRCLALTDELLRFSESPDSSAEQRLSAKLYELLLAMLGASRPKAAGAPPDSRERILAAADAIRSRCEEPWTLARMAETADYSVYHFDRLFRGYIGKSPMRFLLESRIVRAKRLLITGRLSVGDIAAATGFSQSSYFIKRFKELEGLTPQQFREQRT